MAKENNEEWAIAKRKKGSKTGTIGYTEIGGLYKRLYAVLLKPSENQWANFDSRFEVKFK